MKREQLDEYKHVGRMVNAAMYLRKSREEKDMSMEETLYKHHAALMAYADKYGYTIRPEDIYQEVISGESLFARPKMLALLEAVAAERYEAVLCMDMQRLGRGGMYDQGFILDTFKYSETLIVTPERIYDMTKELDEEAAEMQTFLSRSEYRMITKRLQRGLRQVVENGAYTPNAPFGYRKIYVGKLSTLEIVPEEAEYVRQIFQMYADGDGCTRIEQALNAMGIHGRRGSRFNRNTIRLILTNPVYIGKIRWNKTSTVRSGIGRDRQKKTVYNDPEQWKIIDGKHPPIITRELWDKVQFRRQSQYFYVDNKHIASPLAGMIRCSKCGHLMNMQGQAKGVPYLYCPTKGCCAGAKFDFVEKAVYQKLSEIAHGLEVDIQSQIPPDTSNLVFALTKAEDQLHRLDDRRNRLYSLLEDGIYTRAVFSERMQALAQEEQQLNQGIASLKEEIRIKQSRNSEKQLQQLKTVLDRYRKSTLSGRKELLQSVISLIYYTKEKKTKPGEFSLDIVLRDFF